MGQSQFQVKQIVQPVISPFFLRSLSSFSIAAAALALLLAGCGSAPSASSSVDASGKRAQGRLPALPRAGSGKGGYYQDDGPGDTIPEGLMDTPDAEPRVEPFNPRANRPYVVFGKTYTPITDGRPYKQRGMASWYGRKFHGQKTSSGELYDMYKMTAAHPTLPIPSYVRVTSIATGNQVIVKVNDRGPFHPGRIIDLSFTAAYKLGYLSQGSGEVEVERLLPDEIARINAARQAQPAQPAQSAQPAIAPAAEAARAGDIPVATPVSYPVPSGGAAAPGAASAPAPAPAAGGFYLQFGAYNQAANAEAARNRMVRGWAPGMPAPEVAQNGKFYRLYSGPFASRDDAETAARHLQAGSGVKPVIVQR